MSTALAKATEKIAGDRVRDHESAVTCYRESVRLLRDQVELKPKQLDNLAEALEALGLTETNLTADVAALAEHDSLTELTKDAAKRQAALMAENEQLNLDRERLEKEAKAKQSQIHLNAQRHSHLSEMRVQLKKLVTANPRLFATTFKPVVAAPTVAAPVAKQRPQQQPAGWVAQVPAGHFEE